MADRAAVATYLEEHGIHDILYSLLESMSHTLPANPHQFIVDHMFREYPRQVSKQASITARVADDDEQEEEEEEEAKVGALQSNASEPQTKVTADRRRNAISAERWSDEERASMLAGFERPIWEKSEDVTDWLHGLMREVFLFRLLDDAHFVKMINAMCRLESAAGDILMKQGVEGSTFYVVFEGECDVLVRSQEGEERRVITCKRGDSFGEIGLMHPAPAVATVRAKTDALLYTIDRKTFKAINAANLQEVYAKQLAYLNRVAIFDVLTPDEKARLLLAGCLYEEVYEDGMDIMRRGQVGERLYIVSEGECECYLPAVEEVIGDHAEDEVLGRYAVGDYFGEIALLTNRLRACSVRAVGPTKILKLDRKTFTRILGPLPDLLKRCVHAYNLYMGM